MKKILFLLLIQMVILPGKAFAQPLGISISPALITIKNDGKQPTTQDINITNKTTHNVSYSIAMVPFLPSPLGNGEPILQKEVNKKYNDLFQSIVILEDNKPVTKVDLAPLQKKSLKLVLDLPSTLTKNDYYFTLVLTSIPTENENNSTEVTINQAAGINILLSYGTPDQSSGEITDFSTLKFVGNGPVNFKIDLKNNSNSFIRASGNILIKNMFGQTIGKIDLAPVNILANSERSFKDISWNEKLLLGFYSVKTQIALSPTGPLLEKETHFIAFPIKYLIQVLIIGTLIIYIFLRLLKRRK